MSFPLSDMHIQVVPASQRVEALWQLFAWEPEPQRRDRLAMCLESARSDPQTFQFLLEAVHQGVRLGSVWGHVIPGRVANIWPPNCLPEAPPGVHDHLQTALDERLSAAGVVCGQALLAPAAERFAADLMRHGYCPAARLLFFACDPAQFPSQRPHSELQFEVFQPDQIPRLERLIDETYCESLDAPILNGLRSTRDVIDGYRLTGDHLPQRWFFVRHQDRDVGCLLLTEYRQGKQWELIYMGLISSVRGRGWGEILVRQAQWLAREAGATMLLLGVDQQNQPAIAAYARCGFDELDRRLALIKQFTPTQAGTSASPFPLAI